MKNAAMVVLALALAIFAGVAFHYGKVAEAAELALARNEAKQATGACGDQFLATVSNGEWVDTYIGGVLVHQVDVAAHFQEQTPEGDTIVYRRDGREKTPIMIRRKR